MNRAFSSGQTQLVGRGIVYPVPIPLDPAVYKGALVVGRDPDDNKAKLYFSDGVEWTRSIFDTTISEQIERFVDDLFLNGFDEENLPDPTLTENIRRYAFNNTRGLPGFVWNDQWNYLTDEARAAEIAEEITLNTIVVLSEPIKFTVGPTGDFATLGAALERAGGYSASSTQYEFLVEVEIQDGVTLNEQILLWGQMLGFVRITSAAANKVVPVDVTGFTQNNPVASASPSFLCAVNSEVPQIACLFEKTGDAALSVVGIDMRGSSMVTPLDPTIPSDVPPDASAVFSQGFRGFNAAGVVAGTSSARIITTEMTGTSVGLLVIGRSNCNLLNSRARGAVHSVSADVGAVNIQRTDYRRVAGEDSAADLRSIRGSITSIIDSHGGTPAGRDLNVLSGSDGIIMDTRVSAPATFRGLVAPTPYTVGTLPSASVNTGVMVYVSNGAAGQPTVAFSDGTNWLRVDTRTAVST
jgi:hypothetical protein